MMDDHLQELASLYVFDLLEPNVERAFVARMEVEPELRKLVDELTATAASLAHLAPTQPLPPQLEGRVLARIHGGARRLDDGDEAEGRGKIIPFPAKTFALAGWGIAAALALGCFYLGSQWVRTQTQLETVRVSQERYETQIAGMEKQGEAAREEIAQLKEHDALAKIQIASLSSKLAQAPAASAVILWDEEKQRGVLEVRGLPKPANNQDYQLWVIDPQYPKPTSAGIFALDRPGGTRVAFGAVKPIAQAQKFAVSLERKGGAPEAQGSIVLLGE